MIPLIMGCCATQAVAEVEFVLENNRFALPANSLYTHNSSGVIGVGSGSFTQNQKIRAISTLSITAFDLVRISAFNGTAGGILSQPSGGDLFYTLQFEANFAETGQFVSSDWEFRITSGGVEHVFPFKVFLCKNFPALPVPSYGIRRYASGSGASNTPVSATVPVSHASFSYPSGTPSQFVNNSLLLTQVGTTTNYTFNNVRTGATTLNSIVSLNTGYFNLTRSYQHRTQDPLTGNYSGLGVSTDTALTRSSVGYSQFAVASFMGFDGNAGIQQQATPGWKFTTGSTSNFQYGYTGGLQGYWLDGSTTSSTPAQLTLTGNETSGNPSGLHNRVDSKGLAMWIRRSPNLGLPVVNEEYLVASIDLGRTNSVTNERARLELMCVTFSGSNSISYRARLRRENGGIEYTSYIADVSMSAWTFIFIQRVGSNARLYEFQENGSLYQSPTFSNLFLPDAPSTYTSNSFVNTSVSQEAICTWDFDSLAFFNSALTLEQVKQLHSSPAYVSIPF